MDVYEDALALAEIALNEERRANESRRNFLKYLFHEVCTPLNSISIGIELLERHCSKEEEVGDSFLSVSLIFS